MYFIKVEIGFGSATAKCSSQIRAKLIQGWEFAHRSFAHSLISLKSNERL